MKLPAFKSSKMTRQVAQVIALIYGIYAIFAMPLATLILSLAAGLIVLGIFESMELAITATILVGIVFNSILRIPRAFMHKENFQTLDSKQVSTTLADMRRAAPARLPLSTANAAGTMASSFAEGFADAATMDGGAAPAAGTTPPPAASASSKPAATTEGLANKTDGLFKLGELPAETKGGPHIDTSTTLMNALQGLDKGQISRLTDDTRKLLDTQKTLLNMMQSMKPMLTDGKELLATFSGMFGSK
jgi:hypothetical protein